MAFPCKLCIVAMTCHEHCYKIIEYSSKVTLQKFQKLKRCFDCGHPYFEIYTPIKNDNDYQSRFDNKIFYDHFHIKCPNCRSIFLTQLEFWRGHLKKEKYGMVRMGKLELDQNIDEGPHWWSPKKTLKDDYNEPLLMRGSKLMKVFKFGLERT